MRYRLKLQRVIFSDFGGQTDTADCKNSTQKFGFGIDFGVDTSTQTDDAPVLLSVECKKYVRNDELIEELIDVLGVIAKMYLIPSQQSARGILKNLSNA